MNVAELLESVVLTEGNLVSDFNVTAELQQLKNETKTNRKTGYKSSRLDKYAAELLQLKYAGASTAEITRWLRSKRIKVAPSTTLRWLKKNG